MSSSLYSANTMTCLAFFLGALSLLSSNAVMALSSLSFERSRNTTGPRALHLSLHGKDAMRSMWFTSGPPTLLYRAVCQFGSSPTSLDFNASGSSFSYTAGGFNGTLHEVVLELANFTGGGMASPDTVHYRCGDQAADQFSDLFSFTLQSERISADEEEVPWIGERVDEGI